MEIITQNEKILYIGIDVHKDTYSLCCFDFFRNELSDEMTVKATKRIRTKMRHLEERGKNYNVSSAVGARELACFVWGMMNGKIA